MGPSNDDLWHVKLSEGCVVEMTVDELDTAFNAGRISGKTPVIPPGDFRWVTLGEAAGLEEPAEDAVPYSIAPIAADITPSPLLFAEPPLDIDVDLASDTSLPGLPKRRRSFGRILTIGMAFAVLVGAGVAGGAYAARPAEFKQAVFAVRDRFEHVPAQAAVVAAPPPPETTPAREAVPASQPQPQSAPAATTTAGPRSLSTTSVSNLPDAKAAKDAKDAHGKKKSAPATRRHTRHAPKTGTLSGGDKFDPMNGSL